MSLYSYKKNSTMRILNIGLIVFTALTLVLQSCQKKGPEDGRYPILFDCKEPNTKTITTIDNVKSDGFVVRADYSIGENSFYFEQDVKYNQEKNIWASGTTEYWWPGANYTFNAIYPKPSTEIPEFNVLFTSGGYQISDFDIRSQIDVLGTTVKRVVPENMDAPTEGNIVNLDFKHLLALVSIQVKAEVKVVVNDITLMFVPVKANYGNGIWNSESQGNIEKSVNMQFAVNDNKDVTDGGFLVIPGSSNGVKLRITTSDKNYELNIPSISWVAGTKYTYTLIIKQNDIIFDEPSVEEWDEENAVGSVIIK